MALCSQVSALFKKNFLLMKRNCFSTTCQFLLPLILLIFILLLRKAFDIENISVTVSDLQFMRSNSSIWPTYPDNPKAVGQADSKFQGLNLRYPFDHCFSSNRTHVGIVRDPAKADLVEINQEIQSSISITSEGLFEYKEFSSIEQLNDYVRDDNYTLTGDFPELCFAYGVGSSSNEGGKRKYTYSLHYYSFRTDQNDEKGFPRDIPSTLFPSLSPFTSSPDLDSHEKWLRSSYMYMVNLISNAIMNKEIDLENSGRGQDSLIPKGRITSGFTAMKFPTYQDDEFAAFIGFLVPFFIVIAYLTPIIIYSFRMVRDKETRLKEGMKIMGMTDLAYFLSYFLQYIIINTVIAFFGAGILLGAFSYIGYVYLFALLWLYGMAIFGLVYFFQALMDKSSIAIILSILIYFIFYFVSSAVVAEDTENISKMFISLLPPTALQLGFTVIARFEISFIALSSDNMKYQYNNYSVANMYLMLFIDTFVYILIGFYLENVLPQQYGTRKKLWFLCTKNYWCSSKKKSAKVENSALKDQEVNHDESNHLSDKRIKKMGEEKSPSDDFQSEEMYLNKKQEGYLKIDQIRKTFDDGKKALNGVSFNLYKDEIFALLGHNGAGKSTLINILSGLFESSGGKAIYNGENILENMDAFHKQIGICPQHDVLFADLSVKEHLELFARFKGITSNVESEILKILTDLELIHKQDELSQNLSGGQKRKLSISIALIGGSEIVFLDEPSSNMDITSRRRLWDILKKFTKNRIIILTTHFMEEASVLGKRIGILSEGKLKCLGTPLFLINRFGKNIALNCIKGRNANDEGIINFVNSIYSKHSNGRSLEYEILTEEILFRIPKNSGDEYKLDYKKFFAELDENTQSIGVRSYSASMPTLEDVFLLVSDEIKKGDGIIQKSSENKDQTNQLKRYKSMDNTVNEFPRTGGFSKFLVDLKWSIIKRDYMAFRNWRVFILEIMCPIILVLIGLGVSSVDFITDAPLKNMTLSEYQFLQESLVNRNPYYSRSENIEISGLEAVDRQKFVFEAETAEASLAAQLVSFNNRVLQKYNATRTENPVFNDSSTNSYLGAYYFLDFNKSSNIYEFVTFANIKSRNSQPIMTQAMINAIISQAVGKEIDIIVNSFNLATKPAVPVDELPEIQDTDEEYRESGILHRDRLRVDPSILCDFYNKRA